MYVKVFTDVIKSRLIQVEFLCTPPLLLLLLFFESNRVKAGIFQIVSENEDEIFPCANLRGTARARERVEWGWSVDFSGWLLVPLDLPINFQLVTELFRYWMASVKR